MGANGTAREARAEQAGTDEFELSLVALRQETDGLRRRIAELECELAAATTASAGRVADEAHGSPDDEFRRDRLTGLVSREVLIDRLDHCMVRSDRTSEPYALLFCDLDGFKLVNDLLGHEAGDTVLIEVARRLQRAVRAYDTVARFGGDEFVVLLEDINGTEDALAIAHRIVVSVAETIALPDAQAAVGVSIGVAHTAGATESRDVLLARADAAMYEAKRAGKGRVELFGPDLDRRITDRRELGKDLARAIERAELELWYRPVISLDTGHISCLEGSVRWNHPTRGLLEPATFIPIAHATGMIEQIDQWVLGTAATDVSGLRRQHPSLVIWITVSARLLMRDGGPQEIQTILDDAGADACSIGIEVGEESVVHNFADAVAALHELHGRNVCIALDNFSGQLAVPQLLTLRPDTVKLDRSFLTMLGADIEAATAIRSLTGMIRPLGITVVAKGVNTREQLASVISLNCDAAQGTIAGQPCRANEIDHTPN